MKRARKTPWFVAGMLCATMLATTVGPALAAVMVPQTLEVHTGVEVYVDDKRIDAGETHGNPDAFIYNGTTYVAVAAVSKSLGEKVIWDGENKRVYIGDHDGASQYLLDVCPPYETTKYERFGSVKMAGGTYRNGFSCYWRGSAVFNLNGMYDELSFYVGHIDGTDDYDGELTIYLDGQQSFSIPLESDMTPEYCTVPLNGALNMRIELYDGDFYDYGMAEIRVS